MINPNNPIDNLAIGSIIEVDGTHIIAELDPGVRDLTRVFGGEIYAIGQFGSIIRIHFGRRLIYGYVCRLRMKADYDRERGLAAGNTNDARIVEADLFGEGEWILDTEEFEGVWELRFERGVSTFPLPLQQVYLTPKSELSFIYGQGKSSTIILGEHVGSGGTPCHADLNELIGKHTAIVGSTGSGKSGTVAAVLHSILDRGAELRLGSWNPRILILDPHDEYGSAFPGHLRLSTDRGTLALPYWFLNLHETIELVVGKTEFVATSQANIVKVALLRARRSSAGRIGLNANALTVDSPTPYMFQDFVNAIEEQKPAGSNKKEQEPYVSILQKLEVLANDARLDFLMRPWDGQRDGFADAILQFLGEGNPVRVVDLSGIPNEIAGLASAVIARTLFSFKLWQTTEERAKSPVLLVCEEAHRYVPNLGEAQYQAAQEAIRRIAKEGRKYGLGLLLVSQRPSEVESTVLSQCNTWIVLRITNDKDREQVRGILPDSLAGLTNVLSGLRRREAIFVGQAAMLPSRVLIRALPDDKLPRSQDIDFDAGWQLLPTQASELTRTGLRWRLQQRGEGALEEES